MKSHFEFFRHGGVHVVVTTSEDQDWYFSGWGTRSPVDAIVGHVQLGDVFEEVELVEMYFDFWM